ncbi:hypothetical protein [Streptomyces sp. NPDC051704]|uniref:hypothetical protein n=1 Tax=Streptomyces sp. NPDC051704 TaxID=3365671 RepID=UPI0037A3DA18
MAPLKALFDLVCSPGATTATQARWRGPLVVAVDGTLLPVPDAPANHAVFVKQRCNNGAEATVGINMLISGPW